jgi:diaminopimelate decarboxylase/aspartate kinase
MPAVTSGNPWVVLKFGGTSVSSAASWRIIEAIVRARLEEQKRPLVVHSALAGVSNRLEAIAGGGDGSDADDAIDAIERQHKTLADELGIDGATLLAPWHAELRQLATGMRLLGEASPKTRARAMALGELMATSLGSAFLARCGIATRWVDARECLVSERTANASEAGHYLAARCAFAVDAALQAHLAAPPAVVLTQGFIARDDRGDTVLLGRGGSDTSASYFGAKLQAARVEIWTDVPGMFAADPRSIPSARLLHELDYDEAQEIASTGAKVLHPRCIAPVRAHGIPLWVASTEQPEHPGTIVGPARKSDPQVKAISVKKGITLVSMDTMGMWQQVGFLADAFACFKRRGLSVDLVSTSETNVTVTLDPGANVLVDGALAAVVADLAALCQVRVIGPCAAVSLVGRRIRAILPRLAPALEVFAEQQVHLVTQAASDLNLSFVVEEKDADRLAADLHALLIHDGGDGFGPAWSELVGGAERSVDSRAPWWAEARERLVALARKRTPLYVYDAGAIDRAVTELSSLPVDRILYALKANPHPEILRRFAAAGLGFECVSPGELDRVCRLVPAVPADRILFTPSYAGRDEYRAAIEAGCFLTLDGTYPLRAWGELFRGRDLLVRVDLGHGRGHHAKVRTAGDRTKFGVPLADLAELKDLADACGARIVGLHSHAGSGILDADHWSETAARLAEIAAQFPDTSILDLGGGLGVPDSTRATGLDLDAMGHSLAKVKAAYPRFAVWLEPGRRLVAQAGALLASVTQLKQKGGVHYLGVDAGMNSLIRPALYGAHHEIVNLTRLDEPADTCMNVVGPICETADVLGAERMLPAATREGDVILIANAGAYGFAMASRYNLREPAVEQWLEAARARPN